MSVYDEKRQELEKYEFMMGTARGRLAVSLDILTDALVLVGQHGVYCASTRNPNLPAMDIRLILKGIEDAKQLVSDVMQELRNQKSTQAPAADLPTGEKPAESASRRGSVVREFLEDPAD